MTALEDRRDREIASARAAVGVARQRLHRAEVMLLHVQGYWAQYPAEAVR
jgi:hypothetical protein